MRVTVKGAAGGIAGVSMVMTLGLPGAAAAQDVGPAVVGDPTVLAESDGVDGYDRFGASVAVSGDLLVVGASEHTTPGAERSGAAYIYERSGEGWALQATVLPRAGVEPHQFGATVAISDETIFVGSPNENLGVGTVYVYEKVGAQWARTGLLSSPTPEADDQFGAALAVDGDTLVVNDGKERYVSSVDVFVRGDSGWAFDSELRSPEPGEWEQFGSELALDGDTMLVGATRADTYSNDDGAVYVYTRIDDTWQLTDRLSEPSAKRNGYFGSEVAVDGDTAAVSTSDSYTGNRAKVFVYVRSGQEWTRQARLIAEHNDDEFGAALGLDGDNLLVGAPSTYPRNDSGTAYLYQRNGQKWNVRGKVFSPQPEPDDAFGSAIAVSDETLVITAIFDDLEGAAFVYDR